MILYKNYNGKYIIRNMMENMLRNQIEVNEECLKEA